MEARDAITVSGLILVLEGLIIIGLTGLEGREGILEVLERVVGTSFHLVSSKNLTELKKFSVIGLDE